MQTHAMRSDHDPDPPIGPVTIDDYLRMWDDGTLAPDARAELLDGYVIEVPPPSPEHGYSVMRVAASFGRRLADRAYVSAQNALYLDERSLPQPDVTLSPPPAERYAHAHPTADDALLVVEVSRSSLALDLGRKRRAYARRGAREYWVVDLVHERVEMFREPRGEEYAVCRTAERGERIAPAAFPDAEFAVDDFLPPPTR